MSINGRPLANRLLVKQQWFCDVCGGVIHSDRDGMLEWNKTYETTEHSMIAVQNDFQIVHGRWTEQCIPNRTEAAGLADWHLHWCTGSDGLNKLLSKLADPGTDRKSLTEIIKRLHVDLYEEARSLLPEAIEDGYELHEDGYIPNGDLEVIIRKFGNKD